MPGISLAGAASCAVLLSLSLAELWGHNWQMLAVALVLGFPIFLWAAYFTGRTFVRLNRLNQSTVRNLPNRSKSTAGARTVMAPYKGSTLHCRLRVASDLPDASR